MKDVTRLIKIKKTMAVTLALLLLLGGLSSCGKKAEPESKAPPAPEDTIALDWAEDSLCAVGVVANGVIFFESGWKAYEEKYELDLDDIDSVSTEEGYETFLIIPRYPECEVIIESLKTSGSRQVPDKVIKDGEGLTLLTCNVSDIRSNARVTIRNGDEEAVFEPQIDPAGDYAEPQLTGLPSNVIDISLPPVKDASRFLGEWEMLVENGDTTFVYNLLFNDDGTMRYYAGYYLSDIAESFTGKWIYKGEKDGGAEVVFDLKSDEDSHAQKGTYLLEVTNGGAIDLRFISGKSLLYDMVKNKSYSFFQVLGNYAGPSNVDEAFDYLYDYLKTNVSNLPKDFAIMDDGEEYISGENFWIFMVGEDSPEKFTTLYHYAVSPSGRILCMDFLSGDWEDI